MLEEFSSMFFFKLSSVFQTIMPCLEGGVKTLIISQLSLFT